MAQFTITASNITTNSATIELTSEIAHTAASSVDVTVVSSNGVEAYAGTTTIPVGSIGDVISVPVTGLRSNMEYTVTAKTGTTYTDTGTFTTTDDPTARTATQSQWEDLADKVEAASVAQSTFTDLTTADYNWPTNNPTKIALWLLPPGCYKWDSNLGSSIFYNTTTYVTEGNNAIIGRYITNPNVGSYNVGIMVFPVSTQTFIRYVVTNSYGSEVNSSTISPLAISGSGAPTTSTPGVMGQVYVDTSSNLDNTYLCAGYRNGYVWKQLTS